MEVRRDDSADSFDDNVDTFDESSADTFDDNVDSFDDSADRSDDSKGKAGRDFTYSRAPDSLASPGPLHPNSLHKGNTLRRRQVPRGSRQEEVALGYVGRNRALGHPVCDGDPHLALPRRGVVVVAFVETLERLGNHGSEVIQISSASQAWQVWVVPRRPGTIGTIDVLVVWYERHLIFHSLALVYEAAVMLTSAFGGWQSSLVFR